MLERNQKLPVKMHEKGGLLVAAFPMPGLEPQDISVIIEPNNVLRVSGAQRDVGPNEKDGLIAQEWQVGPYERTIELPFPVDGTATNLTYGNGVLAISMPRSEVTRPATLHMERVDSTTGFRMGHSASGDFIVPQ